MTRTLTAIAIACVTVALIATLNIWAMIGLLILHAIIIAIERTRANRREVRFEGRAMGRKVAGLAWRQQDCQPTIHLASERHG